MGNNEISLTLIFIVFFITVLVFSLLINRLFLKFVRTLGIRNIPEDQIVRWHPQSKPSVGGLSFYIIFLISVSVMSLLPLEGGLRINNELIGLLLTVTLGFIIGLADDAYDTNPYLKFLGQFTCANLLFSTGIFIELTPYMMFNYTITVLWVIGIMNSINMLDNMDGITASVSVSVILSAIIIMIVQGDQPGAYFIILLGVLAALIGFLFYNWFPAKMYMGDTGSQFLGSLLATIGIIFFWNFGSESAEYFQIKRVLIPLTVFMVPIFDTVTVFFRRSIRGQSPFVGGKDHITHHLAYLGLRDGSVATVIVGLCLISIAGMYFLVDGFQKWTLNQSIFYITGLIIIFVILQVIYEKGKTKQARNERNS